MQPVTAQPVAMIRFDVADRMMLCSLDCLVLCYQEQRTRGFAAYEAMRCVTFSLRKKFIRVSPPIASHDLSSGRRLLAKGWRQGGVVGYFYRSCRGGSNFLSEKSYQNRKRLSAELIPTNKIIKKEV